MAPSILLSQPDRLPISVGIFNFLGAYTGSATQLIAAASVLSLLPAVVIFFIFKTSSWVLGRLVL
jgi:multiple sugar transport system permease protein